jgi:hypothetical protein
MNLSLGGIVKGVTTGLETLVETGNPVVAAGAGAIACVAGGGNAAPGAPAQSPLLQELAAENPFEQQNVNQLADFASLVDPMTA